MSRETIPGNADVVTDDLPEDTTQPTDKTQWPCEPCAPEAIHDLYPPIGTRTP